MSIKNKKTVPKGKKNRRTQSGQRPEYYKSRSIQVGIPQLAESNAAVTQKLAPTPS